MRRFIYILLILALLAVLGACAPEDVTLDDATVTEAAFVSLCGVLNATMTATLPEGVTVVNDVYTFTNYDSSGFGTVYTSINGIMTDTASGYVCDFSLSGGDVEDIQFTVMGDQMNDFFDSNPVTLDVTANEKEYTVTVVL